NVLVDTSWWNPADLATLFALVPPGQILFASDAPYGPPSMVALMAVRFALQAGLTPEQVRSVASTQLECILAGQDPHDLGPPPGSPRPFDLAAVLPVMLAVVLARTPDVPTPGVDLGESAASASPT